MRFILQADRSVELNYMWLPTWLGHNHSFKKDLEQKLGPKLVGRELTEEVLDEANQMVIDYICEANSIPGLRDYLDGIKFVEL
jgi:hypothetical protein